MFISSEFTSVSSRGDALSNSNFTASIGSSIDNSTMHASSLLPSSFHRQQFPNTKIKSSGKEGETRWTWWWSFFFWLLVAPLYKIKQLRIRAMIRRFVFPVHYILDIYFTQKKSCPSCFVQSHSVRLLTFILLQEYNLANVFIWLSLQTYGPRYK